MNESIKKGVRNWLNIQPAQPYAINIQEVADFELTAIRNRIWYRGDGNELEQMYLQNADYADKRKFWSSKCSPGMEMRKIHTGLPSLIVRTLSSIVLSDMNDFEFKENTHEDIWGKIADENNFEKQLEKVLKEILYIGDGAYKISMDSDISQYPILEWYPGDRIEIVRNRGRVKEIVFKTPYVVDKKQFVLHEHYGYGYIENHLYRDEKEVPLKSIKATEEIADITFDKSIMLAVPIMVYESTKFEGRGGSIFDGKLDSFDALDESWSQWIDALRAGRSKEYIPDRLIPRDPNTGAILKPNAFDNRYIQTDSDAAEDAKNKISLHQPSIPHESYQATYSTALDLCLQGIISPSTLGIDVKKLDNALAQREKEKTTLYTRDKIIRTLQDTLPKVVECSVNAYNLIKTKLVEEVEASLEWGEYANPSFEAQIEAISKAKQSGIMSIEKVVDELYGDTLDDKGKKEEVARIKNEQGIVELQEPSVNVENLKIKDNNEGVL